MSKKTPRNEFTSTFHPVNVPLQLSSHLKQIKHHVFPGLNLHHSSIKPIVDVEDATNFYKPPPAVIRKPIPCVSTAYITSPVDPQLGDCVLKLVREKLNWKRKNDIWKRKAQAALRNYNVIDRTRRKLKENKPITVLPYVITQLADHATKDPDEYFDGLCNWYYGNAMTTAVIGGETCLLYAGGEHLHKFCFSLYHRPSSSNTIPEVSPQISISLAEDSPIYDIVCGGSEGIGVRQRNYCYFFSYDNNSDYISLNRCAKLKRRDYPFISMEIGDEDFCTVDANRNIQFWVPESMKNCVAAFEMPSDDKRDDCFVRMKYSKNDSRLFSVVDRKKLYLYDKRVRLFKPTSKWNATDYMEFCENISLLVPSVVDENWYVGLTHTCLLFDVRIGFAQKWTHMLPQAPSIGAAFRFNREESQPKECLLLGAQNLYDIVAIYNKWNDGTPVSNVSPVSVPNRIDTLHEARVNGVLCDPSFTKHIIGMAPYKKKKRIGVFTLSSSGNVFHQSIHPRKASSPWDPCEQTQLQEIELNHLKNWEADYMNQLKNNKPTLKVTRVLDMSAISQNIVFRNPEIPPHPVPNLSGKAVWKKSKKKLQSYNDFFSSYILQDFGLDEESEWGSDEDEEVPVSSSSKKVENWLNSLTNDADHVDIDELFEREDNLTDDIDDTESVASIDVSLSPDNSTYKRNRRSFAKS